MNKFVTCKDYIAIYTLNSFYLGLVMFHEVTKNNYLANTAKGNTGLGSSEPLVTVFVLTVQNITLFSVCFCFKTPY